MSLDEVWIETVDSAVASGDARLEIEQLQAVRPAFSRASSLAGNSRLSWFVDYALKRRFGWSEAGLATSGAKAESVGDAFEGDVATVQLKLLRQLSSGLVVSSPSSERGVDEVQKNIINECLDSYLEALRTCRSCRRDMILALRETVATELYPFVRGQTHKFFYEWLKTHTCTVEGPAIELGEQADPSEQSDTTWLREGFSHIQFIIVQGLTDVWSAIRKACANRLFSVAEAFDLDEVQLLFQELLELARSEDTSWQAVEGSLLGMTTIIKRFRLELVPQKGDEAETDDFLLHFHKSTYRRLPAFMSGPLQDVLFQRLAHPQLSVRESTIKAFAALLSRSDEATTLSTMMEALEALKAGSVGPDAIEGAHGEQLLGAGQAEGVLGLLMTILKQIPADLLAQHWPRCLETLDCYLAHPASTVRQISSNIFECVAARVTGSGSMLPAVMEVLTKSCEESSGLSWEWREGRLLAFELILRRLVRGQLAHLLQMELRLELKSPDADGQESSPLPLWPQRRPRVSNKRGSLSGSNKDGELSAIDRLRKEASKAELRVLWEQLLAYTIRCLSDPRWELRRMGDQVLPLLTQVIYWYDLGILLDLWERSLNASASPAALLAACATLKYAMRLSVRMSQLLQICATAGTLVRDRAEQVQSLLMRFAEAAVPLALRTHEVFSTVCSVSSASHSRDARLLELCIEILLYASTYAEACGDEQLEHVANFLQELLNHTSDAAAEPKSRKRIDALQSSILSSVYVVLPDLALKVPPRLLLGFARLLVEYAARRDEMNERLCILEALRRLLMRVVHSVTSNPPDEATGWPWDSASLSPTQGGFPQPSSPTVFWRHGSPPPSPAVRNTTIGSPPETPETPSSWPSINVANVNAVERNFPLIRQVILAKIDALVNLGQNPKLTHSRLNKWAAIIEDQQCLEAQRPALETTAIATMQGLLPMVEHKGLEMGVLRSVMELLCAGCILVGTDKLKDCLPLVVASMMRRLGGEGVLSKVEKETAAVDPGNYAMLANDTTDTNLEGKAEGDEEDEEDEDVAMSSMDDEDWDDWDDEADVFNEDALVTEFGRFLEALCSYFPELVVSSQDQSRSVDQPAESTAALSTAPAPVSCRKVVLTASWPGVPDESARVLNWLVDKHISGV